MNAIIRLFRLTADIAAKKQQVVEKINEQYSVLGVAALNGEFLPSITDVLYEAHAVDGTKMIQEIFFPRLCCR